MIEATDEIEAIAQSIIALPYVNVPMTKKTEWENGKPVRSFWFKVVITVKFSKRGARIFYANGARIRKTWALAILQTPLGVFRAA